MLIATHLFFYVYYCWQSFFLTSTHFPVLPTFEQNAEVINNIYEIPCEYKKYLRKTCLRNIFGPVSQRGTTHRGQIFFFLFDIC